MANLLENNGILSKKYLLDSESFFEGKVIRTDYKMTINGYDVQATFETYLDTNQTFLKNAWVKTDL